MKPDEKEWFRANRCGRMEGEKLQFIKSISSFNGNNAESGKKELHKKKNFVIITLVLRRMVRCLTRGKIRTSSREEDDCYYEYGYY